MPNTPSPITPPGVVTRAAPVSAGAAALIGLGLLGGATPAAACAVCACGDPTLNLMGAELGFAGRVRLGLDLVHRTDTIGDPELAQVHIVEQTLTAAASWSPSAAWSLSASAPLGHRRTTDLSLAETELWSVGDAELRARYAALRRRPGHGSAQLGPTFGLRAPTAPVTRGPDGAALPMSAQLGSGAWTVVVGGWAARSWRPWSIYGSATLLQPLPGGRFPAVPGRSGRATVAAQWQPGEVLGLRAGLEGRLDQRALYDGAPEPDTGGAISFATGDLLWSPTTDLILRVGGGLPVINALTGFHDEGPLLTAGLTVDL